MAQLPFSVNIIVLVLLSWSDASPIKLELSSGVLPIGKTQIEKSPTDGINILPTNNVISDSQNGKGNEKKSLFGIDESTLIKLKGIKIIPKDSGKSNIMKILFPRKQLVGKVSSELNKLENKTDDQVLSSAHNESDTDSEKEFIEVDNILLVRDPKDIDDQINNMLGEDDTTTTTTTETYRPIYMEPIEDVDTTNLTLAERLKIAAKRRMMDKMAKLELSIQRGLFKRENTQSNEGPNANAAEGGDLGTDLKKVLTGAAAEAAVLSGSGDSTFENSENGSEEEASLAVQPQEETENEVQTSSTESAVPQEIQSSEEPKQNDVISVKLIIENEKESSDVSEPNLGAALSSSSDSVQENVTKNEAPSEDKSDQLPLPHNESETNSANEKIEDGTVLGSSLTAVNNNEDTLAEAAIETTNGEDATQAEANNSENKVESVTTLESTNEENQANSSNVAEVDAKQESQTEGEIDIPKTEQVANVADNPELDNEEPKVGAALPSAPQETATQTTTEAATNNVEPTETEKSNPNSQLADPFSVAAEADTDDSAIVGSALPASVDTLPQPNSESISPHIADSPQLVQTEGETVGTTLEKAEDKAAADIVEEKQKVNEQAASEVETLQSSQNQDEPVSASLEPANDDAQKINSESVTEATATENVEVKSNDAEEKAAQEDLQVVNDGGISKSDDNGAVVGGPLEATESSAPSNSTEGLHEVGSPKEEQKEEPNDGKAEKISEDSVGPTNENRNRNSENNQRSPSRNENDSHDLLNESESSNSENRENQNESENNSHNDNSRRPSQRNEEEEAQNERNNNESNSQSRESNSRNSNRRTNSRNSPSNSNNEENRENNENQQNSKSSNARSRVNALFSQLFGSNVQGHPLLSRILLSASEPSRQLPLPAIFRQQQEQAPRAGLLTTPLSQLFKINAPVLRRKKHVKRSVNEEEIFVTPKQFAALECSTTRRPHLIERYHAMSSDEKVESLSKALERMMHFVTIAGHVDGYLTNRAKHTVRKIHKLFASSEEQK